MGGYRRGTGVDLGLCLIPRAPLGAGEGGVVGAVVDFQFGGTGTNRWHLVCNVGSGACHTGLGPAQLKG